MPIRLLIILLLSSVVFLSSSQINEGGTPSSFDHPDISDDVQVITLDIPKEQVTRAMIESTEYPLQVGIGIPTDISVTNSGTWDTLRNGAILWRLNIFASGAKAIGIYFDKFRLPEKSRFFAYSQNREYIAGAFTSENNTDEGLFAIQLIPGEYVTLELLSPSPLPGVPDIHITEIAYNFRDAGISPGDEATSDWCEVNINCLPEGDGWQRQKKGVAKIYVKEGGAYFWCTGSLVNNALNDRKPYFLTADHCGDNSSAADYLQWVFYFNYELPGCENQGTPPSQTMAGASLLANANTSGSDFKLLLLDQAVPDNYNPYFNGWNNLNESSASGVTIHHPSGDVKKISTYNQPLISSSWASAEESHWQVYWAVTENGRGVTEGGSSGGPIFNEDGLIVGTLTGGLACCDEGGCGPGTGPDKPDYYGKFSYSWQSNGSDPAHRLQDWLDPDNTGMSQLHGIGTLLEADFEASQTILMIGESVDFSNLTAGNAIEYQWTFEGGNPNQSLDKEPKGIVYSEGGVFDVSLVVSDGEEYDTLVRKEYIQALGTIFPNPTYDRVNIYLGKEPPTDFKLDIIDITGKIITVIEVNDNPFPVLNVDVSYLRSGYYVARLTTSDRFYIYDFIKVAK